MGRARDALGYVVVLVLLVLYFLVALELRRYWRTTAGEGGGSRGSAVEDFRSAARSVF